MKKVIGLIFCFILIAGGVLFANNIFCFEKSSSKQELNNISISENSNIDILQSNSSSGFKYFTDYQRQLYLGQGLTYDVYLINFCDYAVFNESTYQKYFNKFNDVTKWFLDESNGKCCPHFNFYVYNSNQSVSFMESQNKDILFDVCLEAQCNGTLLSYYGPYDKKIIVGSYPECVAGGDAFAFESYVVIPSDCKYFSWVHELMHTNGLPDLYPRNSDTFKKDHSTSDYIKHDVMNRGIYDKVDHPVLNAFDKTNLAWIDEGDYEDGVTNYVENISTNGHYVLYTPTTKQKTIAYKLPYNKDKKQSFYLEVRECDNKKTLSVNRFNTKFKNSYDATDISSLRAATLFEISEDNNYNLFNEIYDAQNNNLKVIIKDVEFFDDRIEFNVMFNADSECVQAELNITSTSNYDSKVNIYIDGDFICTTTPNTSRFVSVKTNNLIRIESADFKTYTYNVDKLFFVRGDKTINISLTAKNKSPDIQMSESITSVNKCQFEIFVTKELTDQYIDYYAAPNLLGNITDLYIIINGVEYYYVKNLVLDVKNYSNISIRYGDMIKNYFYADDYILDYSTNTKMFATKQNGIYLFSFEIIKEKFITNTMFFVKEDGTAKPLDIISVYGFNTNTGILEYFEYYGYKNNSDSMMVCFVGNYSYFVIKYQNYYETKEVTVFVNPNVYYYTVCITQNFVQDGLDWFSGLFS